MGPWRSRNHGCRISDAWTVAGLRTLILENELLCVIVLVDKGSDIIEFRYKPLDLDFLLTMPGELRDPGATMASAAGNAAFIDYYTGGWNDVLPNGGPFATYQGAELGQHGEFSLLRWHYAILADGPDRVAARLWCRGLRTPFLVEKTLALEPGRAVLRIAEQVTNEAGQPLHLMWGQHIAFGRPFLDEGAVIDAPAGRFLVHPAMPAYEPRRFKPGAAATWPYAPGTDGSMVDASQVPPYGTAKAQEMAYLTDLAEGWYAITNPVRRVGFGVRFDPAVFRYIWYWQQLGDAAQGYPWWGRTHTAALEPWTSYPTNGLPEAVANGTARLLAPDACLATEFMAVAYTGLERVRRISADGNVA